LSPPGARAYNHKKGGGGGFRDKLGRELETLGRITSTGRLSATDMVYRVPTDEDIRASTLILASLLRGHQGLNLFTLFFRCVEILAWKDRGVLELEEKQPLRIEGTTVSSPELSLIDLPTSSLAAK
jgi:hypothetical protein